MRRKFALLVLSGLALGQITVNREFRRVVKLPASGTVSVVHKYGDVTVSSTDADSVIAVYHLSVTGSDPAAVRRFAAAVDVPISLRGDTFDLVSCYPPPLEGDSSFGYWMDISLLVPDQTGLVVANRFGDVVMAGFTGRGRVLNEYGDVDLNGCRACEVTSRFGDLFLSENLGPMSIEHEFGNIVLAGLADRVVVSGRYSDMRAALSDMELAMLRVMAEAGTVELELPSGMPFRLNGTVSGGSVDADMPVIAVDSAGKRLLRAFFGQGGPDIDLSLNSSRMIIRTGCSQKPSGSNRR